MRYITLYAILGSAWCLLLLTVDTMIGEPMETALSDILVFIVIFVTVICIRHSPMFKRVRGENMAIHDHIQVHEGNIGKEEELPICPSCNRRYRPIQDAEGHMICQWCGHFKNDGSFEKRFKNLILYRNRKGVTMTDKRLLSAILVMTMLMAGAGAAFYGSVIEGGISAIGSIDLGDLLLKDEGNDND